MENLEKPKSKMGFGKKLLIGIAILFGIAVIANIGKGKNNGTDSSSSQASTDVEKKEDKKTYISIGQTLKTDYFEVTVNKAELAAKLNTGNEFTDQNAGEGNQFLLLNTTFKNIDKESRMLTDGIVYITYNGKDYEFDKSETILAEGFGLMLDQLNPLISKTTTLVYKIPKEIKGPAYYRPGRADSEEKIYLGDFK